MQYFVKIVDNEIVKILDDRWSVDGDNLVGRRSKSSKMEIYIASEFQTVTAPTATDIKVKDGAPAKKTKKEKEDKEKEEKRDRDRKSNKEKRINRLNRSTVEVDGKVFQTRESDEIYLRGKIERLADGETTRWILNNNNVTTVTKEQLIQVLNAGFNGGEDIFNEYMDELEAQGRVE